MKRTGLSTAVRKRGAARKAPARAATTENASEGHGTIVKPVSRAFQILRYLTETGVPVRAVQVARALDMHNSTCFTILRTMVVEGVLEFDPDTKTYRIGVGLLKLLGAALADNKRIAAVKPLLQGIARRHRVTATLWRVVSPNRIVLVATEHGPAARFQIQMGEGQRLPRLSGATGKLIAAFGNLGRDEAEKEFNSLRWGRPVSFDAYWRGVRQARKAGWAVDDGNFSQGVLIIDAPVFDRDGVMRYSLSTVTFKSQQGDADIAQVGSDLVTSSKAVSALLF